VQQTQHEPKAARYTSRALIEHEMSMEEVKQGFRAYPRDREQMTTAKQQSVSVWASQHLRILTMVSEMKEYPGNLLLLSDKAI
jgi:hypothetical protein